MIAAEEQATHNNDPSKDDEVVLEDVVFGDSQQQGDDGCEPFAVAEHLGKAETKSGEKAPSLTPLEQDQRRIQRCLFVAIALMVSVAIVAVLAIVLPAERDDGGDDRDPGNTRRWHGFSSIRMEHTEGVSVPRVNTCQTGLAPFLLSFLRLP